MSNLSIITYLCIVKTLNSRLWKLRNSIQCPMCCSHKLAFVNIFTWYIPKKKDCKQAQSNYIVTSFFMVDYPCIYMALYNIKINYFKHATHLREAINFCIVSLEVSEYLNHTSH